MANRLNRGARIVYRNDLTVCNCAECGKELLGERMAAEFVDGKIKSDGGYPPIVAKRVHDRPFCGPCVKQIPALQAA